MVKSNRLVLNFSKTKIMTINPNSTLNLHLNNQKNIKLLGVVFNCRLEWDDHIDTIVKRPSQKITFCTLSKMQLEKRTYNFVQISN